LQRPARFFLRDGPAFFSLTVTSTLSKNPPKEKPPRALVSVLGGMMLCGGILLHRSVVELPQKMCEGPMWTFVLDPTPKEEEEEHSYPGKNRDHLRDVNRACFYFFHLTFLLH